MKINEIQAYKPIIILLSVVFTLGLLISRDAVAYDKITYTRIQSIKVFPSGEVSIVFEDPICFDTEDYEGDTDYWAMWGTMYNYDNEHGVSRTLTLAIAAKLSGTQVRIAADNNPNGQCRLANIAMLN